MTNTSVLLVDNITLLIMATTNGHYCPATVFLLGREPPAAQIYDQLILCSICIFNIINTVIQHQQKCMN